MNSYSRHLIVHLAKDNQSDSLLGLEFTNSQQIRSDQAQCVYLYRGFSEANATSFWVALPTSMVSVPGVPLVRPFR